MKFSEYFDKLIEHVQSFKMEFYLLEKITVTCFFYPFTLLCTFVVNIICNKINIFDKISHFCHPTFVSLIYLF